jgi:hypothetical protein
MAPGCDGQNDDDQGSDQEGATLACHQDGVHSIAHLDLDRAIWSRPFGHFAIPSYARARPPGAHLDDDRFVDRKAI